MKYLVDANVLCEPTRPAPVAAVVEWLRAHEREIVVDPIILGEIRFGVLLLRDSRRRRKLEQWFFEGVSRVECLSWDAATGLVWAELIAKLRRKGKAMPIKDSLIAATALFHKIPVATRNTRDFLNAGVKVVNPFESRLPTRSKL